MLFNIFLDDLLIDLTSTDQGASIGSKRYNNFAYADDVTVYSATTTGLQLLIDKCASYAKYWRFSYGLKKTKCLISGKKMFMNEPKWMLDGTCLENVQSLTILGTVYSNDGNYVQHTDSRIMACRRSIYGLQGIGMNYPGLMSDTKAHIWKTVGVPTLTSGMDSLPLTKCQMNKLESMQGSMIKRCLGLAKRNHHQNLLRALNIPRIEHVLRNQTASLFNRICNNASPAKDLNMYMLSLFVTKGHLIKGTLVDKLVKLGLSPLQTVFNRPSKVPYNQTETGLVDSLKYLVMHENFIKPYSDEYILTKLLTKSF